MSSDDPYVRFPDHIELSLDEAGELLEVLDAAAMNAASELERVAIRSAARMVTAKLWPDLDDLLDGDDPA